MSRDFVFCEVQNGEISQYTDLSEKEWMMSSVGSATLHRLEKIFGLQGLRAQDFWADAKGGEVDTTDTLLKQQPKQCASALRRIRDRMYDEPNSNLKPYVEFLLDKYSKGLRVELV